MVPMQIFPMLRQLKMPMRTLHKMLLLRQLLCGLAMNNQRQGPWFTHEISDEDSDIDEEPDEEPDIDEGLDLEQMSLVN